MSKNIDISIVIPNYNTSQVTWECVLSIISKTKNVEYEVIIVDNASTDGSYELLKNKFALKKNITVMSNLANKGYGSAANCGAKVARGEYLLILNSDTLFTSDILESICKYLKKNVAVGILGCKLINKSKEIQPCGGYFPNLVNVASWMLFQDLQIPDLFIKPFHPKTRYLGKLNIWFSAERELDWIHGAFLVIRKSIFKKIGGFDEDYFMYTEEVDLCYRAKKSTGCTIVFVPKWEIMHLGGASGGSYSYVEKENLGVQIFFRKHRPLWQTLFLKKLMKVGMFTRYLVYWFLGNLLAKQAYEKAYKNI